MYPTHWKSLFYHLIGLSITISITLPCLVCSSHDDPKYTNCKQPFKCGDPSVLGELRYPFWGINRANYCGTPGHQLKCINNTPFINISTVSLQVVGSNPQSQNIRVATAMFRDSLCPSAVFSNTYINDSIDGFNSISPFLDSTVTLVTILYGCPLNLRPLLSWSVQNYSCSINNTRIDVQFVTHTADVSLVSECKGVAMVPILQQSAQALDANTTTLPEALNKGFDLDFGINNTHGCNTCVGSGGQCGYNNLAHNGFVCYCPDKPYPLECPRSKQGKKKVIPIVIGVSAGAVVLLALLGSCLLLTRRRRNQLVAQQKSRAVYSSPVGGLHIHQKCKPITQDRSVEDCLKNYASLVPRRYTYANVKKMTNSFKQKLGEGGYGTVFKGSLHDGHAVAVKVWKQSKGDGKDFINEVMSISRTCHVNIVPLLGFCFEGHKQALIYEFMPNGSLEKFISGRDSNDIKPSLSASKLFEIVVGIARGLEYLHRGCNTRIVHFDIKPHNILLDEEFTPKISDFGLAKSFKEKESIISMSGARGTAGYIAPEVFLKSFGGVSYKSDVYSYGMMVLEMAGYTKRVDHNAENNSSEMYFPQWIYKQLEQETTIDHGGILNEELERKMVLVGLWCIQTYPVNRPPMSRVVEMLEGKAALLQVPPLPSLASPPRQQQPTEDGSGSFYSSTT